jgi:AcrR family transcriptional regulator
MVKKIADDGTESRERILQAARAEFAEKGFEGARVDEIARRADVNKALIYYYFGSKQKLLDELLKAFLQERREERTTRLSPDREGSRDLPDRVAAQDLEFLERHRDILRVALMEDLKTASAGSGSLALLEHWVEGLADARDFYAQRGYPFRYTPRVMAALYFQHLGPSLLFAAVGDSVAAALGVEPTALREEFLKLSLEITQAHYQAVFGSSNSDPRPEVPRLARERPASAPAPGRAAQSHVDFRPAEREALLAKMLRDGRVERFPLKEKARVALLEHLSGLFEGGRTYAEKEVNGLLSTVVEDFAKARRYLVDYGFLDRKSDGSAYHVP